MGEEGRSSIRGSLSIDSKIVDSAKKNHTKGIGSLILLSFFGDVDGSILNTGSFFIVSFVTFDGLSCECAFELHIFLNS